MSLAPSQVVGIVSSVGKHGNTALEHVRIGQAGVAAPMVALSLSHTRPTRSILFPHTKRRRNEQWVTWELAFYGMRKLTGKSILMS